MEVVNHMWSLFHTYHTERIHQLKKILNSISDQIYVTLGYSKAATYHQFFSIYLLTTFTICFNIVDISNLQTIQNFT